MWILIIKELIFSIKEYIDRLNLTCACKNYDIINNL